MAGAHGATITLEQVDDLLRHRNIFFSHDDLYHLLSSFDKDMDGKLSFKEFKNLILTTFKTSDTK